AARDDRFVAVIREVGDLLAALGVEDQRADGDARDRRLAPLAVLRLAAAVIAAPRGDPVLELEIEKRRQAFVGAQDHAAAVPAVAARRTAVRAVFLAQEGDAGTSAVTAFDLDLDFVDEFHGCRTKKAPGGRPRGLW